MATAINNPNNSILSQSNTNINSFLQSAFAGSRVDYDRPSLKANPRGAYYNGTVYLFENANESTFVHEMSHAYMDVLERLAQGGNAKAQKDLDKIRKWLNKKEGDAFTVADWERFASGFEMYMR